MYNALELKFINIFTDLSSHIQWGAAEVSVNETLSVRVVEVINPSLFYVVPIKARGKNQKYI